MANQAAEATVGQRAEAEKTMPTELAKTRAAANGSPSPRDEALPNMPSPRGRPSPCQALRQQRTAIGGLPPPAAALVASRNDRDGLTAHDTTGANRAQ